MSLYLYVHILVQKSVKRVLWNMETFFLHLLSFRCKKDLKHFFLFKNYLFHTTRILCSSLLFYDIPSHIFVDGYFFSNCGYPSGPLGPEDVDCKEHYKDTSVSVRIGDESKEANDNHTMGYVTGIQRWQVPRSGLYT